MMTSRRIGIMIIFELYIEFVELWTNVIISFYHFGNTVEVVGLTEFHCRRMTQPNVISLSTRLACSVAIRWRWTFSWLRTYHIRRYWLESNLLCQSVDRTYL